MIEYRSLSFKDWGEWQRINAADDTKKRNLQKVTFDLILNETIKQNGPESIQKEGYTKTWSLLNRQKRIPKNVGTTNVKSSYSLSLRKEQIWKMASPTVGFLPQGRVWLLPSRWQRRSLECHQAVGKQEATSWTEAKRAGMETLWAISLVTLP